MSLLLVQDVKKGSIMKYWSMRFCSLLFIASLMPNAHGYFDNPHFYRPPLLFAEPRLATEWLGSANVFVRGGSTRSAIDGWRCGVPLLDIYGTQNMHELGVGVPGKDMSNPLDILLVQLSLLAGDCTFATQSFGGKFSDIEALLNYTQNFGCGLFCEINLPVKRLKVDPKCIKDLTPIGNACPNQDAPEWQAFLTSFDAILSRYCLNREPFSKTGVGDLTFFVGLTSSYQKTTVLDYVDASLRIGFLAPTSKERDEDNIYAIPLGYNGHWGVPIAFDVAFGSCEWLTLGVHLDTIFFASKTRTIRMQTGFDQHGIIHLAKGTARIDHGTLWRAGAFFKADHCARGLSLGFGYSFINQNGDQLCPCDPCAFPPAIVNSSDALRGWKMHAIHVLLEYDFAQDQEDCLGLRIGFTYDRPVSGKRIFKTDMIGGMAGLDIAWDF